MSNTVYYKLWCVELETYLSGGNNQHNLFRTLKGIKSQLRKHSSPTGRYGGCTFEIHVYELVKTKVLLDTEV